MCRTIRIAMFNSDKHPSVDSTLDFLLAPVSDGTISGSISRRRPYSTIILLTSTLGFLLLLLLYTLSWRAPSGFPSGAIVTVEKGMTLSETAALLTKLNVIRSPFWFKVWSTVLDGESGVKAGDYFLAVPTAVFRVAWQFTRGIENSVPIRVTVPEGLSNADTGKLFSKSLPRFNGERFLKLAAEKEGYLFPDTYLFSPSISEEEIIEAMEKNFARRTAPLQESIRAFGRPIRDVLTMASLIEGEVRTMETRRQVSGILWKRFELGMPLQVDAVFPYIVGKNMFEVTLEDLKINSPYNTYLYPGLPPGPINNPSLDAIEAALAPTPSKYLYYLTDKEGQMRYATTHAEHLVNRAKYLGK